MERISKEKKRRLDEKDKKDKELRKDQEMAMVKLGKEREEKDKEDALAKKKDADSKVKTESKKKVQRLFALRNVKRFENEGWIKVKKPADKHGRELGVKTHVSDLVLMEK